MSQMTLQQKIADLYRYLAKNLYISEPPKIVLTKDEKNAKDPFGKTAYYDPSQKIVRVYTTNRHDTDILRSFAHEIIHHWQNEKGTLHPQGDTNDSGDHYAQNNPHLRKIEMQAYLLGNILFRDWQDENRYGPPKNNPTIPITDEKPIIKQEED